MASWGAWHALRARSDIGFALVDLPDRGPRAVLAERGHDRVVLIDRRLSPAERLCALAHELIHLERGGSGFQLGQPAPLGALVAREEARVERLVAERLVDQEQMDAYLAAMTDMGLGVEPWMVAEEFGVDHSTAVLAMEQAKRRAA